MHIRALFALLALLLASPALAQRSALAFDDMLSVYDGAGVALPSPWAGGMNAVLPQQMDLDGDGQQDLLLLDRTSGRLFTALWKNGRYVFDLSYAAAFPQRNYFWLLLRDFDADGRTDLICGTQQGVEAYRNVTPQGVVFPRFLLFNNSLKTTSLSTGNAVSLQVDITDVPAMEDMDGDGDLDFLCFRPTAGGTVELHLNQSKERYGDTSRLEFRLQTARWGGFEELGDCQTYLFDNQRTKAIMHAGSAMAVTDLDGDGRKDVLIGEISCNNLVAMYNKGNSDVQAVFRSADATFPKEMPVDLQVFPAPYILNIAGKRQLLVSSAALTNEGDRIDFRQSLWQYEGQGQDFRLQTKAFLQQDMLDIGESAMPVLADVDGDGLEDLLLGGRGNYDAAKGRMTSAIAYYRNVGSAQVPAFRLLQNDFLGIAALGHIELQPQWGDVDGDGVADLLWVSRDPAASRATLQWIRNKAAKGAVPILSLQDRKVIALELRPMDVCSLLDIDKDGNADLLVGRNSSLGIAQNGGLLQYYRNQGGGTFALEQPDYLGLGQALERRGTAATLLDIDQDGKTDLLLGDKGGRLSAVLDFRGAKRKQDRLLYIPAQRQQVEYFFGKGIYPAALGGSRLLLGTMEGGLLSLKAGFYEDITAIEPVQAQEYPKIYPNPVSLEGEVYLQSPWTGRLSVYNMLGQCVWSGGEVKSQMPERLSLQGWKAGMYVLQLSATDGRQWTGRLWIR